MVVKISNQRCCCPSTHHLKTAVELLFVLMLRVMVTRTEVHFWLCLNFLHPSQFFAELVHPNE